MWYTSSKELGINGPQGGAPANNVDQFTDRNEQFHLAENLLFAVKPSLAVAGGKGGAANDFLLLLKQTVEEMVASSVGFAMVLWKIL
jgi:hypothetical protein